MRLRLAPLLTLLALVFAADAAAQAPQLHPPTLLELAEPTYPPEALAAGLEAKVVLRLTIDDEGRVTAAEVVEPVGHGFDEAALEASWNLRFAPARRGETPIASRILFTQEFFLPEPEPVPPAPEDVAAEPAGEEVLEVVVRGRSEADRLRRSAEAVQVLEFEAAHSEAADLGEVLARVEGVGVRRGGGLGSGTRFSLAGFTDNQIRFFLDGVPLELAGHPFGISNVPVNLLERVEIYRGVVPIRFGADALGGAVNLVTRKEREGTHGFASYQLGSFGTHRLAAGASHRDGGSGFFVRASGFHDQAENDYTVNVRDTHPVTRQKTAFKDFERFHDAYRGSGAEVEVGFADRPWARRLSLQGFFSDFDKELQHDQVMENPYGDATWDERSGGLNLRYQQDLSRTMTLHAIAGYARERTGLRDVGDCVYSWSGECFDKRRLPGEIEANASDRVHHTDSVYGRFLVEWALAENHAVRLSLAPTAFTREGDERVQPATQDVDPLEARQDLLQHVGGIEYEVNAFDGRLQNIAFLKSYLQMVRSEEPLPGELFENRNRDTHRFGVGNALRYRFYDWFWGKTSYELATRLPTTDEIFGDGVLVDPNLTLAPEESHNFNLGATVDAPTTAGNVRLDVNGFLRLASDLIILKGQEASYQHHNVYRARSVGVEAAAGWTSPDGLFEIDGNLTWMDMRNMSDDGVFKDFSGDRIPNQPWLFANLGMRLNLRDTLGAGDNLVLGWQSRYVHEFLRDWEGNGARELKDAIPSQLLHAVTATQRIDRPLAAFTVGAEIQNVTDERAYDFFGLQRPGRSFHLKATAEF